MSKWIGRYIAVFMWLCAAALIVRPGTDRVVVWFESALGPNADYLLLAMFLFGGAVTVVSKPGTWAYTLGTLPLAIYTGLAVVFVVTTRPTPGFITPILYACLYGLLVLLGRMADEKG